MRSRVLDNDSSVSMLLTSSGDGVASHTFFSSKKRSAVPGEAAMASLSSSISRLSAFPDRHLMIRSSSISLSSISFIDGMQLHCPVYSRDIREMIF